MRREAKTLHAKAVDSLILSVDHFNRAWDRGRSEAVLILLDRAFELLLKAIIVHKGGSIRENVRVGHTIGFDHALRKCLSDAKVRCLTEDEAVSLQAMNLVRDAAQHHIIEVSEEQLYVYAQSGLTLFGKLSREALGRPLREEIPERILPICARPPRDLSAIFEAEFRDIKAMVGPGSRHRLDAHAKLRALAVLQNSINGRRNQPTNEELLELVGRINADEDWRVIFPGVATLVIDPEAEGPGISIRITRNQGEAVQLVNEGEADGAVVAIRKINDLDYYSLGIDTIAKRLRVTRPKLLVLVEVDQVQHDPELYKLIKIGSQKHKRYSQKAQEHLSKRLREVDLDQIWAERPGR